MFLRYIYKIIKIHKIRIFKKIYHIKFSKSIKYINFDTIFIKIYPNSQKLLNDLLDHFNLENIKMKPILLEYILNEYKRNENEFERYFNFLQWKKMAMWSQNIFFRRNFFYHPINVWPEIGLSRGQGENDRLRPWISDTDLHSTRTNRCRRFLSFSSYNLFITHCNILLNFFYCLICHQQKHGCVDDILNFPIISFSLIYIFVFSRWWISWLLEKSFPSLKLIQRCVWTTKVDLISKKKNKRKMEKESLVSIGEQILIQYFNIYATIYLKIYKKIYIYINHKNL